MDKLYFIGMPGSGKSTLGKEVAAHYSLTFLDLDHEIENHEGRSIKEIFEVNGEDHFREVEKSLLEEVTFRQNNFLLSTGGGAPCFYNNITFINQHGVSVFINVPLAELVKRLEQTDLEERPKIGKDSNLILRLETTFRQRIDIYQKAHLEVGGVQLTAVDIIKALDQFLKLESGS